MLKEEEISITLCGVENNIETQLATKFLGGSHILQNAPGLT
jgi:hypothetical protein